MRFTATTLLFSVSSLIALEACNKTPEVDQDSTASVAGGNVAAAPVNNAANPVANNAVDVSARQSIPAGCKIMASSDWKASINAQPPVKPRLGVTGKVTTSSAGYTVTLARNGIDFNPRIVTLELAVLPPPSGSVGASVMTTYALKVQVPDVPRNLQKVIINCGGSKLTEITDIIVLD